ncbi:hypothetical protein RUND412_005519 [Rhizina undulata]
MDKSAKGGLNGSGITERTFSVGGLKVRSFHKALEPPENNRGVKRPIRLAPERRRLPIPAVSTKTPTQNAKGDEHKGEAEKNSDNTPKTSLSSRSRLSKDTTAAVPTEPATATPLPQTVDPATSLPKRKRQRRSKNSLETSTSSTTHTTNPTATTSSANGSTPISTVPIPDLTLPWHTLTATELRALQLKYRRGKQWIPGVTGILNELERLGRGLKNRALFADQLGVIGPAPGPEEGGIGALANVEHAENNAWVENMDISTEDQDAEGDEDDVRMQVDDEDCTVTVPAESQIPAKEQNNAPLTELPDQQAEFWSFYKPVTPSTSEPPPTAGATSHSSSSFIHQINNGSPPTTNQPPIPMAPPGSTPTAPQSAPNPPHPPSTPSVVAALSQDPAHTATTPNQLTPPVLDLSRPISHVVSPSRFTCNSKPALENNLNSIIFAATNSFIPQVARGELFLTPSFVVELPSVSGPKHTTVGALALLDPLDEVSGRDQKDLFRLLLGWIEDVDSYTYVAKWTTRTRKEGWRACYVCRKSEERVVPRLRTSSGEGAQGNADASTDSSEKKRYDCQGRVVFGFERENGGLKLEYRHHGIHRGREAGEIRKAKRTRVKKEKREKGSVRQVEQSPSKIEDLTVGKSDTNQEENQIVEEKPKEKLEEMEDVGKEGGKERDQTVEWMLTAPVATKRAPSPALVSPSIGMNSTNALNYSGATAPHPALTPVQTPSAIPAQLAATTEPPAPIPSARPSTAAERPPGPIPAATPPAPALMSPAETFTPGPRAPLQTSSRLFPLGAQPFVPAVTSPQLHSKAPNRRPSQAQPRTVPPSPSPRLSPTLPARKVPAQARPPSPYTVTAQQHYQTLSTAPSLAGVRALTETNEVNSSTLLRPPPQVEQQPARQQVPQQPQQHKHQQHYQQQQQNQQQQQQQSQQQQLQQPARQQFPQQQPLQQHQQQLQHQQMYHHQQHQPQQHRPQQHQQQQHQQQQHQQQQHQQQQHQQQQYQQQQHQWQRQPQPPPQSKPQSQKLPQQQQHQHQQQQQQQQPRQQPPPRPQSQPQSQSQPHSQPPFSAALFPTSQPTRPSTPAAIAIPTKPPPSAPPAAITSNLPRGPRNVSSRSRQEWQEPQSSLSNSKTNSKTATQGRTASTPSTLSQPFNQNPVATQAGPIPERYGYGNQDFKASLMGNVNSNVRGSECFSERGNNGMDGTQRDGGNGSAYGGGGNVYGGYIPQPATGMAQEREWDGYNRQRFDPIVSETGTEGNTATENSGNFGGNRQVPIYALTTTMTPQAIYPPITTTTRPPTPTMAMTMPQPTVSTPREQKPNKRGRQLKVHAAAASYNFGFEESGGVKTPNTTTASSSSVSSPVISTMPNSGTGGGYMMNMNVPMNTSNNPNNNNYTHNQSQGQGQSYSYTPVSSVSSVGAPAATTPAFSGMTASGSGSGMGQGDYYPGYRTSYPQHQPLQQHQQPHPHHQQQQHHQQQASQGQLGGLYRQQPLQRSQSEMEGREQTGGVAQGGGGGSGSGVGGYYPWEDNNPLAAIARWNASSPSNRGM